MKQNGVLLESALESDFNNIMKVKVHTEYPEGSFRRIFLDQKLQATGTTSKSSGTQQ